MSQQRGGLHRLSQHKSLAMGREFVVQRLPNPSEYETTLQELEGLRAQLFSAREEADTTTTIRVPAHQPSSIHHELIT